MAGLDDRALEIARAMDGPGRRTEMVRLSPAPGADPEAVLAEFRRSLAAPRSGDGSAPRSSRPAVDVRAWVASLGGQPA